ncbi:hypothetical protein H4R26_005998 [Coemansia thaxteri]|uniref:Uncharacterized protein n=1 Tax=Coemansia thaxteri TaxID=2663907 RepID=A0A9W8BE03_9FUNG|nr:hypothetical protein H4R26_005998 [Coemansia thaxteri]
MAAAVAEYKQSVRSSAFPVEGVHTYAMPAAAEDRWRAYVQQHYGLELSAKPDAMQDTSTSAAAPSLS